ncbi:MAG: malonic semialdehyde reductase [Betaproteobacteria bacterium]|jgi:3-hydroxypropanoate dehydrogenase|nr:malonic semialdehyde reductase [Betaproteobacteria bacterium]
MSLHALSDAVLDQLFRQARTVHAFKPQAVSDDTIHQLYDLLKWGPTAFNAQPARYVFVKSEQAKAKLIPALSPGNVPQVQSAAVTVIVAYDTRFAEHLPTQFPGYDAKAVFDANPGMVEPAAFRNSSLQGAYLILAARALGLDSGAMSGFNPQAVNEAFFADGRFKVNFLLNIGVADPAGIYPRAPRLAFEEAAQIV